MHTVCSGHAARVWQAATMAVRRIPCLRVCGQAAAMTAQDAAKILSDASAEARANILRSMSPKKAAEIMARFSEEYPHLMRETFGALDKNFIKYEVRWRISPFGISRFIPSGVSQLDT